LIIVGGQARPQGLPLPQSVYRNRRRIWLYWDFLFHNCYRTSGPPFFIILIIVINNKYFLNDCQSLISLQGDGGFCRDGHNWRAVYIERC
jgi:hypothetical protein